MVDREEIEVGGEEVEVVSYPDKEEESMRHALDLAAALDRWAGRDPEC